MKSIRMQLTLYYTLAVFVVLIPMALFLYWGMINLLYKADYQFLDDEVDTIQYIMESTPPDMAALKQEVVTIPVQHNKSIYRYYIRLYDSHKNIIAETPGMDDVFPHNVPFSRIPELLHKKSYLRYSSRNNNFLSIQAPIWLNKKSSMGLVQVAVDVSYQHHVTNDRENLFLTLISGAALALLLGFVIARKGLKSLFVLTQTAQTISAASLHQRINPKAWPSELSNLAQAFNQMLDRIESAFLNLKQFSADLSHEMRTPITNMQGEAGVALSHPRSNEEYRQVLESNLEELDRLSHLVENILFLAQTENPLLELKMQRIRVEDEIAMVIEFNQPVADEKNIAITLTGKSEITANVIMFRRMMNNLLSNALKYTLVGGKIEVMISNVNDDVQIQIKDTGIGIAKEHLSKIFDRFYRAESARTLAPGTGLGLAIVKSIVDLHHGSIVMESTQGIGSIIIVTLPRIR